MMKVKTKNSKKGDTHEYMMTKIVGRSGKGGRVYLPHGWIGKKVTVILYSKMKKLYTYSGYGK